MEPTSPWKKPNEVMQLHKMKRRKKALQERMRQPLPSTSEETKEGRTEIDLNFSRLINGDKRKNPFSKNNSKDKKMKLERESPQDESNDRTLFAILNLPAKVEKPVQDLDTEKLSTFSNLLQKFTAEHSVEPEITEKKYKHLPIDWALKTKVRLMSPKPFAWTAKLKASEEASGTTGFVRCLDTTSSPTLDTSPRALFHQTCLYWQHPHLPWLDLYPRSSGKVAATSFMATNEEVKQALLREWTESFRSLFQLLRALHCPYFYVCANTFTCLFRAAGLCGDSQPCALVAPTTRGFRQTLRQEDVEFTMPLRPDNKKKLNTSEEERRNSSFDSCYDTMDEKTQDKENEGSGDEDPDQFLSQLGLETDLLKKINNTQARITHNAESSVDSAAESLVLVRGADAQAFFNFLLNCKSLVSPTGPTAGVPPTLLAPTAFHGGTLQSLKVRENTLHCDNKKYYSIEMRGPILPTAVHTLFDVLRTSSSAQFSATFAHHQPTLAFSWAAQGISEDESSKDKEPNLFSKAFNKENLSDCGISETMLQHFCSPDPSLVKSLDSVKYNPEDDTYTW
ncbi:protein downstream neighbor of son homolog [Amyelois transitella]|uniref:protein downstream neighbor of son homolog n=1 Tax=Amyelois transitella TaxID=680683 RepID=UPI00067CD5D3|nr:protein downstream neighbor of son homolog [Amyelois transitella]XP_060800464.1 protein downstream neighbor of son homolog [Amyelois transitella]